MARVYLDRLECRVWPLRQRDRGLLHEFDKFFTSEGLQTIPFEPRIFDQATALRAIHRTKTPDVLHLAAAIFTGCTEFWTNDPRSAQLLAVKSSSGCSRRRSRPSYSGSIPDR
jgi:predicted nucleic acid-binding protein